MRRYSVPLGRRADYPHPAPDRTAYRAGAGAFSEDIYQVWSNRAAMLKAVEMSQRGAGLNQWRPFVRLGCQHGLTYSDFRCEACR
jgi:hypothetical protein